MKKCRTLGLITMLTLSSVTTPIIHVQINEWTSLQWPLFLEIFDNHFQALHQEQHRIGLLMSLSGRVVGILEK